LKTTNSAFQVVTLVRPNASGSFPLTSRTYLSNITVTCYLEAANVIVDFEREIESITKQLIEKYEPEKIILFGSAARRQYGDPNDLDFLIIKEDVPFYGIDRMRELDELIDRNVAADLLVYRPDEFDDRVRLGDPFILAILKEGRVLYG